VKPPNQCALDAGQLGEELPRVLTMGGAVSPPAAVRFSIREHVWQREPPVNQVRGELHSGSASAAWPVLCAIQTSLPSPSVSRNQRHWSQCTPLPWQCSSCTYMAAQWPAGRPSWMCDGLLDTSPCHVCSRSRDKLK